MPAVELLTENLTEDGRVCLHGYLQADAPRLRNFVRRPAVLVLPGGGYHGLSEREAEPVALAFMARGFQAFVLEYSVGEHAAFPAPLEDASEAIARIRSHAEKWRICPRQIAVCGFSAGGHLAAAVSTMGEHRPDAMVLGYPCILESMSAILAHPVPGCDTAVTPETPPAFLFHTRNDGLVPVENSLAFAAALDRSGVPFELHIFRDGVHGLSLSSPVTSTGDPALDQPDTAGWFDLCVTWLYRTFGIS